MQFACFPVKNKSYAEDPLSGTRTAHLQRIVDFPMTAEHLTAAELHYVYSSLCIMFHRLRYRALGRGNGISNATQGLVANHESSSAFLHSVFASS
jgi:hypothetical protein